MSKALLAAAIGAGAGLCLVATPALAQDGLCTADSDCEVWQFCANGRCVDHPDVRHHPEGHRPEGGEVCWQYVKCLCQQLQHPAGPSCAPCSYAGEEVVCRGG